jgi:hypothetical protein
MSHSLSDSFREMFIDFFKQVDTKLRPYRFISLNVTIRGFLGFCFGVVWWLDTGVSGDRAASPFNYHIKRCSKPENHEFCPHRPENLIHLVPYNTQSSISRLLSPTYNNIVSTDLSIVNTNRVIEMLNLK